MCLETLYFRANTRTLGTSDYVFIPWNIVTCCIILEPMTEILTCCAYKSVLAMGAIAKEKETHYCPRGGGIIDLITMEQRPYPNLRLLQLKCIHPNSNSAYTRSHYIPHPDPTPDRYLLVAAYDGVISQGIPTGNDWGMKVSSPRHS